jgi:hypothetical protein
MAAGGQDGERGVNELRLIDLSMDHRHYTVSRPPHDEGWALDAIEVARQLGIIRKLPGK